MKDARKKPHKPQGKAAAPKDGEPSADDFTEKLKSLAGELLKDEFEYPDRRRRLLTDHNLTFTKGAKRKQAVTDVSKFLEHAFALIEERGPVPGQTTEQTAAIMVYDAVHRYVRGNHDAEAPEVMAHLGGLRKMQMGIFFPEPDTHRTPEEVLEDRGKPSTRAQPGGTVQGRILRRLPWDDGAVAEPRSGRQHVRDVLGEDPPDGQSGGQGGGRRY